MKLMDYYYDVLDAIGGKSTIPDMKRKMLTMRSIGYSSSSIACAFRSLRKKGRVRLLKDGRTYVTDKWLKDKEDNYI